MRRAGIGIACAAVVLSGCQVLGVPGTELTALEERYTDEHSRFLVADGIRVHVRAEGEGPAVLLLHGLMDSLHVWDDWAQALKTDYRVIRIDVPPFGLSGTRPDRDYGPDHLLPVLDEILDAHGVDSAVVAGTSLGGYFAAYYAAHSPRRVRALALISPAAYEQPVPWQLRVIAMPVIGKFSEFLTPLPGVRSTLRSMYGDPARLSEEDVRRRFELLRAPGNRRAARDVVRLMVQRVGEEPAWIADVEQPTLLIWGCDDQWVPPKLAERWLEDLDEAKLVTFPDVGHLAMEEVPEESVAAFLRFLSRQAAEAPPTD